MGKQCENQGVQESIWALGGGSDYENYDLQILEPAEIASMGPSYCGLGCFYRFLSLADTSQPDALRHLASPHPYWKAL